MKTVFPELKNPIAKKATEAFPNIKFLPANSLAEAAELLNSGSADSLISGLDFSSRDVLLALRDHLPLKSAFFSSCFICQKGDRILALADGGVNKLPTKDQLYVIVEDTAKTFEKYTGLQPKIAMLSYSTNGSGGKNPDLEKIHFVIDKIRENYPDWLIDGEMQLDCAIDPNVSAKKFPSSIIKGDANVLITPDLNSGNILYKSLERFGGFVCAGPIIQGFALPLADLSRGSSVDDIRLTIKVLSELCLKGSVGGYDATVEGAEHAESLLSASRRRPTDDSKSRDRKGASPVTTGASDPVPERHNSDSQHFGTDGIRKKADEFTPEFLTKIVRGLADYAGKNKSVLIGGDTRESTEKILADLASALTQTGFKTASVGVLPTPAINYCFYEMGFDFAIDVTASHNPYIDNGIKIFERGENYGIKLSDPGKKAIETSLNSPLDFTPLSPATPEDLSEKARSLYKEHLRSYLGPADFSNLNLALDCANGATSVINKELFEDLGATVTLINADANFGQKINADCGSTHLDSLKSTVKNNHLDLGIAFDGDGDRVLMVDEDGAEIDGDQIIAILADHLKLNSLAVTVMSNQGLLNWATEKNLQLEITDVGDSNVASAMREKNIEIGGEQSGHIILPHESTGDGMLTALMVVKTISETKKSPKDLSKIFEKLPQATVNLEASAEQKSKLTTENAVKDILAHFEEKVKSISGRLLVRPSGTENLIRITVWGNDESSVNKFANELKEELSTVL